MAGFENQRSIERHAGCGEKMIRFFWVVLLMLGLSACSKEVEIDPPAELTEFSQSLEIATAWTASVAGDDTPLRLGLTLAVQGEQVYAAGRAGEVAAFQIATGKSLWRVRTRAPLSGGPGVAGDLLAVGGSDGQVIALNVADGAVRWRVAVKGEVLSAPAVAADIVVVRTVDGRVRGLSATDGREQWIYEQSVPRLSLRGTSPPRIINNVVFSGFDNGKVIALNLNDGSVVWEAAIAPSRGRTELERLVDIDAGLQSIDDDLYAVGFQGRIAMLAIDSGQIWWSRDASSHRGATVDAEQLYFSTAGGEVVAFQRRTGVELWRQDVLKNRALSAPVVHGGAVAVADFAGFVHWLDPASGALMARARSGEVRVSNPPVVVDGLLLMINDAGRISAFRTRSD
jgi:outer membrane protein assembly factor BamB